MLITSEIIHYQAKQTVSAS